MRGVAKMLEYKQKRNNGRTPFAGVYKFVCVCVCVCVCAHYFKEYLSQCQQVTQDALLLVATLRILVCGIQHHERPKLVLFDHQVLCR